MKDKKKGEKTLAILDILLSIPCNAAIIFLAATSGARSLASMEYEYEKLGGLGNYHILRDLVDDIKEIHRFYSLLSKLKKQGLIYKSKNNKWAITKKGRTKLALLQKQAIYQKKYEIQLKKELVIVIFDIPEKDRRKRNWIRKTLQELDFKILQRSVWLGRGGLPDEFIKDLRKLELKPHVHIFSIKKSGTII